jgi:membrane-associated phospholipid phosphatase
VLSSSHDRAVVAAALTVFLAGARLARRGSVSQLEARWFQLANGLSHRAYAPVWVLMQFGSLGGALATGAALRVAGRPALGGRVAVVGTVTWAAAKAVKPFVRRGRPAYTIEGVEVRGHEQAGLGYPSGHAAVAAAIAAVITSQVAPAWRVPVWAAALAVGPTRSYVGAHLPLDVLGGAALGIAIGTVAHP